MSILSSSLTYSYSYFLDVTFSYSSCCSSIPAYLNTGNEVIHVQCMCALIDAGFDDSSWAWHSRAVICLRALLMWHEWGWAHPLSV